MNHILYLKQDNKTKDVICFITLRVLVYHIYLGKHVIIRLISYTYYSSMLLNTTEIINTNVNSKQKGIFNKNNKLRDL